MLRHFLVLLCSIIFVQATLLRRGCPPSVETKYGKIEGKWGLSFEGRQYAIFEGIPYAKPPVGGLRFEEPQPIDSWNGTWKAVGVNKCIQKPIYPYNVEISGDEDCLYLNIYVPDINSVMEQLDVVIHIHGGAFTTGYGKSDTNEKYLMDRDIIFATIHYRLGPFGFLSTGDGVVPGNNGLKDQNLALKWIKENIISFGGNPESITLTGNSAGAASVHYHYLSSQSRNLFHRGMSLSGSALNRFAIQKYPEKRAKKLGEALGCEIVDTRLMVDCLKTRPAHLILKTAAVALQRTPNYLHSLFNPVVENGSTNPFLSEYPYMLLKQGNVYDVPWVASTTTHEGGIYSLPLLDLYEYMEKNWMFEAKYIQQYDETIPEANEVEIAEKIKTYYLPEGKIKYEELTKMYTDRVIEVDLILAAKMQSSKNKSPVYSYLFGYDSPQGLKTVWGKSEFKGACHGDDLPYFFGGLISQPLTSEEIDLKNIALDILYSYAHDGTPSVGNVTWKPIGKQFNFLNISGPNDINMDIKTDFSAENFWTSLGLLENGNLFAEKTEEEV